MIGSGHWYLPCLEPFQSAKHQRFAIHCQSGQEYISSIAANTISDISEITSRESERKSIMQASAKVVRFHQHGIRSMNLDELASIGRRAQEGGCTATLGMILTELLRRLEA